MKNKLPKFKSEKEEHEFWSNHSPLDYPEEFKEVKVKNFLRFKRNKKGIWQFGDSWVTDFLGGLILLSLISLKWSWKIILLVGIIIILLFKL